MVILRPTRLIAAALAVIVTGCAYLAVKTPTPAAQYTADHYEKNGELPHESFYVIIFGSETFPKMPRKTHTWGTVIRAEHVSGQSPIIEESTISWMPATLNIRPWSFRVERGVNLGLHETIDLMRDEGEHISMWGPYRMRPGTYAKFRMQKAFLESGRVGYQCIDSVGEAGWTGRGCDCIHAISDLDAVYDRKRYRLDRYGITASRFLVKQLFEREVLIDPPQTHDWLLPYLGLNRPAIHRERYDGPAKPYQGDRSAPGL